jgi:hypothetical protein
LSHVALGHQLIDTNFSFADRLMLADGELLEALRFRRTPKEEAAADEKVSCSARRPIATSWPTPACFFVRSRSRPNSCPRLIQPHIGDCMAANGQMTRRAELMKQAPPLMPVIRYAAPPDVDAPVRTVGELRSK